MAKLKDRVEDALNEARILILGAEVLIGFQFRSVFETGFDRLPESLRYLKTGGLALMLAALALLISPGAYHQIVREGEDGEDLLHFTTAVIGLALLPFAIGLGIDIFLALHKVAGPVAGVIAGLAVGMVALFFWYGWEAFDRRTHAAPAEEHDRMDDKQNSGEGGTPLEQKIKQVLTEARMVLPGAQALLGFQFGIILVEGFDKLPELSKYVHVASLGLVALSTILLMTPAAYHRLVERGEDTERFRRVASRLVLAAMVPLALGVSGDLYVVVRKVSESRSVAILATIVSLILFFGLWFGWTLYVRSRRGQTEHSSKESYVS